MKCLAYLNVFIKHCRRTCLEEGWSMCGEKLEGWWAAGCEWVSCLFSGQLPAGGWVTTSANCGAIRAVVGECWERVTMMNRKIDCLNILIFHVSTVMKENLEWNTGFTMCWIFSWCVSEQVTTQDSERGLGPDASLYPSHCPLLATWLCGLRWGIDALHNS